MFACCSIALGMDIFGTWLVNAHLYPQFVTVLPEARDASSIFGIATLIVLAWIAVKKPTLIKEKTITAAALATYAVSFSLVVMGIANASPAMLLAGAVLRGISTRWFVALVGLSLCRLSGRRAMLAIAAGILMGYTGRAACEALQLSGAAADALCLALPFAQCALIFPVALPAFDRMRKSTPASEARIVQPDSFLPLFHVLFVSIFVFRMAFGFALKFGAVDGSPTFGLFSAVPVLCVMTAAFFLKRTQADALYAVSALLIVAGFLSIAVLSGQHQGYETVANSLLSAGSECFDALMWFALARLGAQNLANALTFFCWGKAVSSAGLLAGTVLGAQMSAVDDPFMEAVGASVLLFAFVAVNLTVFKPFSFQATIEGVRPTSAVASVEEHAPESAGLEERCAAVAHDKKLTPRETEIFTMLAHGRNVPFIQEKLVVSRNTVKTHVSNIYGKLGVHSQQELINLAEGKQ